VIVRGGWCVGSSFWEGRVSGGRWGVGVVGGGGGGARGNLRVMDLCMHALKYKNIL